MKKLPEKYYFLLAEDVRPEPGHKVTVLGLHAAPLILLLPGSEVTQERKPTIPSLCVVAIFLDGEGEFAFETKMVAPGNAIQLGAQKGTTTKDPKRALTMAFKYVPFLIPGVGNYVFSVSLDGKPFEFRFEVAHETEYYQSV